VDETLALARVGILDPLRTVPHVPADVELVVEHAGALRGQTVERRDTPGSASRPTDGPCIKIGSDALARLTRTIACEDLAHDLGLRFIDLQAMPDWVAARIGASDD
jgi:hypothetical protein